MTNPPLESIEEAVAGESPFNEVWEPDRVILLHHRQCHFRVELYRRITPDRGHFFMAYSFMQELDGVYHEINNAPLDVHSSEDLVLARAFSFLRGIRDSREKPDR